MSFNRLKYDRCNVTQYNQETTAPGNYMTATPVINNGCYNDNPRIINQKNGVSLNGNTDWRFYYGPVDVESELLNITRRESKCPSDKYHPKNKEPKLVNPKDCHFNVDDTRLNNPPSTLRGTGWNRFVPLCKNPQENVFFPGTIMTPTRLVVKDNHRPVVRNPKVNDMNPNETQEPCEKLSGNVCATPTRALYQYDVCG